MKRIAVSAVVLTLSLISPVVAGAQRENTSIGENQREAKNAAKQNQKYLKKSGKQQRKALKKQQKAQRRAAKQQHHG